MVRSNRMAEYGSYAQQRPKLIAGARCLDFLNTMEENRTERLTSYSEFAIWSKVAGLVDAAGQERLLVLAAKGPQAAAKALALVREARDALTNLIAGTAPRQKALAAINGILARYRFVLRIECQKAGFHEHWEPERPELLQPLLILLREAAVLLSSSAQAHIHYCAND